MRNAACVVRILGSGFDFLPGQQTSLAKPSIHDWSGVKTGLYLRRNTEIEGPTPAEEFYRNHSFRVLLIRSMAQTFDLYDV